MSRSHVRALGALALLLGALLLAPAREAGAHAAYERSTPAKDEVVPVAPAQVDGYFTQDILRQAGGYFLRVFDDGGTQVSTGDGTIDDDDRTHMFTALPANLLQGRYIVRWMTTSFEDGDTDDGAFCFYAGVQPTAAQQAECAAFEPTPAPTFAGTTQQATSGPTTQAMTPAPTADDGADSDDGGANTGLIIGIVAAVVVAVLGVGGAGLWWRSRA